MYSLQTALPPFKRTQKQVRFAPQAQEPVRNHARTVSMPLLPSQKNSLDVLLDAIDLDQQMSERFKDQVARKSSVSRGHPFKHQAVRRRSRSAPGTLLRLPSTTRWWTCSTPEDKPLTDNAAELIAYQIVQKHIQNATHKSPYSK
ncbi:hypothetical protein CLU79DRAFT_721654 [Phycomyces nitens]|nr:hypothetical protein CLU79DRAFT_721654 [Phycomyces nitens]